MSSAGYTPLNDTDDENSSKGKRKYLKYLEKKSEYFVCNFVVSLDDRDSSTESKNILLILLFKYCIWLKTTVYIIY